MMSARTLIDNLFDSPKQRKLKKFKQFLHYVCNKSQKLFVKFNITEDQIYYPSIDGSSEIVESISGAGFLMVNCGDEPKKYIVFDMEDLEQLVNLYKDALGN